MSPASFAFHLFFVIALFFAPALRAEDEVLAENCAETSVSYGTHFVTKGMDWVRWGTSARYRVAYQWLHDVRAVGKQKIVFVAAHPTYGLEPFFVYQHLRREFNPQILVDADVIEHPIFGGLAKLAGNCIAVPAEGHGRTRILHDSKRVLDEKKNLLVFGSGQVSRDGAEDYSAHRLIPFLLRKHPDLRIVMVRVNGLYGSTFSYGWEDGRAAALERNPIEKFQQQTPNARAVSNLFWGTTALAANLVIFTPKREVTLEFFEPTDFPRGGTIEEMNQFMESQLRPEGPETPSYVPYFWWQRRGSRMPAASGAQRFEN